MFIESYVFIPKETLQRYKLFRIRNPFAHFFLSPKAYKSHFCILQRVGTVAGPLHNCRHSCIKEKSLQGLCF